MGDGAQLWYEGSGVFLVIWHFSPLNYNNTPNTLNGNLQKYRKPDTDINMDSLTLLLLFYIIFKDKLLTHHH